MKKVLSCLIITVLLFTTINIAPFFETRVKASTITTVDGIVFDTSTGTITDYVGSATSLDIPSSIEGVNVIKIGQFAFMRCSTIGSVAIPNTVTIIGDNAFTRCENLTYVDIPNSVITIDSSAFSNCSKLASIQLPNNLKTIGNQAFAYCYVLANISIPESVTSLGVEAFRYCTSLENFTIPRNVDTIGYGIFAYCDNLESIIVDANNQHYCSIDGVLYNKDISLLVQYPQKKSNTTYTIPASVSTIGYFSMMGCDNLITIDIPNSVTRIENYAFKDCTNLQNITIPPSISRTSEAMFSGCKSLKNIIIPNNITYINHYTFSGCDSLENIEIPNSVTYIQQYSFYECISLESIVIPSSVTTIGSYTFKGCINLRSIIIPSSVTTIGTQVFTNSSSELVIYGQAGSYAETYANTNGITFVAIVITEQGIIFDVVNKTIIDYIGNSDTLNIPSVIEGVNVTQIGNHAFTNASFSSVTIPSSVISIDDSAFEGCTNITNIEIPSSVQTIGDSTFSSCTSLYKIDIPSSVNLIGTNAFSYCNNITIYGVSGSYANSYATANNIRFRATSIAPEALVLNASIPGNNSSLVNKTSAIELHFDENVSLNGTASDHIKLYEYNTDSLVPVSINVIDGYKVGIIPTAGSLRNGTKYYLEVDSTAIYSSQYTSIHFTGFPNKGDYVFTTTPLTASADITYVDLVYPKKGWLNWSDNTEVPPIPEGSTQDYIDEIYEWAKQYNLESEITKAEIAEVINEPIDMPIKDKNGSLYFVNDGTGTVKEFARDIIFVEELQPYLENIEDDLTNTKIYTMAWNKYKDERDVYDRIITYNDQISEYFGQKDDSFYLNFVAAGLLETIIVNAKNELGFDFIKPFLKLKLKDLALEEEINNVTNSNNYSEISSSLSNINTVYKAGNQLYRFTQEGAVTGDFVFSIADLAAMGMETSGNKTLKLIGETYQDIQSFASAFSMCLTLGSTIGFYGYVVDFYFQSKKDISKSLKMWYMISDYYIYQNYPNLYQAVFKENDFLIEEDVKEMATITHGQGFSFYLESECSSQAFNEYIDNKDSDAILKRWGDYIETVVTQRLDKEIFDSQGEEGICDLRLALGGLASTIRFCEQIDISDYKLTLLKYISAKNKSNDMTGIFGCPILINVYDNNDELIETISTYGDVPVESITGSFYLGGDDDELKIFIVNTNQYWVEIIPYGEGTMDITLLDDGNLATVYTDVNITTDMTFTSSSLGDSMEITCNQSSGSQVLQSDETVPVGSISITYDTADIMVGDVIYPIYQVLPENATNQNLFWSVSDSSIAQVDGTGVVTGMGMGKVTVTAVSEENPSLSACYDIMVYEPLTQLSIDVSEYSILDTDTIILELNTLAEEEYIIPYINWNSENAGIAFVNSDLELFGISEGTTTITGEYFDLGVEIQVNVTHNPIADFDINCDDVIDVLDIIYTAQSYAESYDLAEYINVCDINNDGIINLFDLVLVSNQIH